MDSLNRAGARNKQLFLMGNYQQWQFRSKKKKQYRNVFQFKLEGMDSFTIMNYAQNQIDYEKLL